MNKDLIVLSKELDKLVKKNKNNKFRYYFNNTVYNSKFLLFNNMLLSEVINESPYKNIVFNYLKKAESFMPGGSELASELLVSRINNLQIKKNVKIENTYDNFLKILDSYVFDKQNKEIIKNCIEFAGADGSIYCKPSKNSTLEVTKSCNPKINVNIEESFNSVYFSNLKETTKSFISIAMDAYLERESEIMTLLEHAKINKLPIVLFCRGMSDYFIKNIKEIILKNNVYVYPYIIKLNNDDPFLLEDICSALNLEKVSAESGDSFYKDLVKKSKIVKLKLSSNSIEFYNRPNEAIAIINKKLSTVSDDSLKKYLVKRKNRLSPNIIKVSIPESEIRLIQEMKSMIKIYNNSAVYGMITYNNNIYPKSCFDIIDSMSKSFYKSLSQIECVVKLKNEKLHKTSS